MTPQGDPEVETDQEIPNEGLETEADAASPDSEDSEVGDDGETAAEGDGADAQEGQVDGEVRKPSRGEVRFQKLSQTAREASERAARLETQLRETSARLARLEQPAQAEREPSKEELALMTPDELIEYRLGKATKGFQATIGQIQWNTYETGDKAAFNALKATDPLAARYADEVETRLMAMRAQGQNVDRERLLTFIIGEKARQNSGKAKQKAQATGQRRIAAQTTRPGSQRSDQQGTRGKMSEAEAREKRLENVVF